MKTYYLIFLLLFAGLGATHTIKAQSDLCASSEGQKLCNGLDELIQDTDRNIKKYSDKEDDSSKNSFRLYTESKIRLDELKVLISGITNDNYTTVLKYSEARLTFLENNTPGKEVLEGITVYVKDNYPNGNDDNSDNTNISELEERIKKMKDEIKKKDDEIEARNAEIEELKAQTLKPKPQKWKDWLLYLVFPFLFIALFFKDKFFKKKEKKDKSSEQLTITLEEMEIAKQKKRIGELESSLENSLYEKEKLERQVIELKNTISELKEQQSFSQSIIEQTIIEEEPSPQIDLPVTNQQIISGETYYIQDKESDDRFKITKASKTEEAWSRFRLEQIEENLFQLYVLEKQEYIDILVADRIRLLEPFFEILPSSDTSKNIIKTKTPALLKKDVVGKYWMLEKLGELEFHRV